MSIKFPEYKQIEKPDYLTGKNINQQQNSANVETNTTNKCPSLNKDETKISCKDVKEPVFCHKDVTFPLETTKEKKELTPDELKILEFINKVEDENIKAIFKSFDQSIEHARKLMEEYKEYIKKVIIPKEIINETEINKQEIEKQRKK